MFWQEQKEIVPRAAIAWIARVVYDENYIAFPTKSEISFATDGSPSNVVYGWKVAKDWHTVVMKTMAIPKEILTLLFFWKPPAALILGANLVMLFFGGGFLFVNVLNVLPPGDMAAGLFVALAGIGVLLTDGVYRLRNRLSPFSLERSTVLGIFPTWTTAFGLFGLAVYLLAR